MNTLLICRNCLRGLTGLDDPCNCPSLPHLPKGRTLASVTLPDGWVVGRRIETADFEAEPIVLETKVVALEEPAERAPLPDAWQEAAAASALNVGHEGEGSVMACEQFAHCEAVKRQTPEGLRIFCDRCCFTRLVEEES